MRPVLYFFDYQQRLIKQKKTNQIIELIQEKELSKEKKELIKSILYVTVLFDEALVDAQFMAVAEKDESFSMYRIITSTDPGDTLDFIGVDFAPDELDAYVIQQITVSNETTKNLVEKILAVTNGDWCIGYCSAGLPTISTELNYLSVKEALKHIQTFGVEILFRCKVSGQGVTDKWVELHKKIGNETGIRFVYGSDALSVVREVNRETIYTSVIAQGREEDVGTGEGKRVDISSIEWSKLKGDPIDKPKGQIHLEDPTQTKIHGIPQKNGQMRKRETVITFDNIDSPEKLIFSAYNYLVENSRPLAHFKAEIISEGDLGNSVTIHHHEKDYHYKTRIFKTKLDYLTGKLEVELGDQLVRDTRKQMMKLVNNISDLETEKMNFYKSKEISKYQDDIMRGASGAGGSVYQVNGIEAGVSNSREIYETVYMDGQSIGESTCFMIQNAKGISFKQCKKGEWKTIKDLQKGQSVTAWALDGTFNANFIKAGKISADIFETSFNATADQLKLSGGTIQAVNNNKKLMELTKNGMEFWGTDSKLIGNMGVVTEKNNPFVGYAITNPLNNLLLRTYDKDILFATNNDKGMFLGRDGHLKVYNGASIYSGSSDVALNAYGNVNITGKLFLNGKELTGSQGGGPGGGGGTGTGGYPIELVTDTEKFAWDWWRFALANGYSMQSAAGVLGNISRETGGTMNPDTDQVNGPAYGIVQWDGSAYPLVGSLTYDGREYVQRLMAAAGITATYSTMAAQARLVEWCMYNGQWIGIVSPTAVDGFKETSDIYTATYAFLKNFERAGVEGLDERVNAANYWYNKFKHLEASTTSGAAGLTHLESLVGKYLGNGQCYAVPAEYAGFLGGCGLGAGTKYALSYVVGNTSGAADIGSAYDWSAVGWKVKYIPNYEDLVVGAIINWRRGGKVGSWYADNIYGHTGVICGLANGKIQTYEQNTELGQIIGKLERSFYSASDIASIVIPPK